MVSLHEYEAEALGSMKEREFEPDKQPLAAHATSVSYHGESEGVNEFWSVGQLVGESVGRLVGGLIGWLGDR